MTITCYTGLMGSGKTYEVVSHVILEALKKGRRIVTNIDGLDFDQIKEHFIKVKFDNDIGSIHKIKNEEVEKQNFFPEENDVDSIVKFGDLVILDEAWNFYPTDKKISDSHRRFHREHRHMNHIETGVCCDLVLIVQDISDLHRMVKCVVEVTYRTFKLKSLGFSSRYRLDVYEGYKLTRASHTNRMIRKYDKEIFPLYKSYSAGAGAELETDKRRLIFTGRKFVVWVVFALIFLIYGGYTIYGIFFGDKLKIKKPESAIANKNTTHATVTSTNNQSSVTPNTKNKENKDEKIIRVVGFAGKSGKGKAIIYDGGYHVVYSSAIPTDFDAMYYYPKINASIGFGGSFQGGLVPKFGVNK